MHRTGYYYHGTDSGVRLLGLPYAGNELMMTIVLPEAQDGLAAIERELSAETVQSWIESHQSRGHVSVSLPKFRIETDSIPLRERLGALGMPLAFDRGRADFTGIADPADPEDRLYIGNVFHRAFIKVSEEGTEAAAATAVVMPRTGSAALPMEFRADHPFLFILYHRASGAVLFMSRVADPTAE